MTETKKTSPRVKGDGVIWTLFCALCLISIVEVFSASSNLTYSTSNYWGPVIKHTGLMLFGVACMIATMNIKCKYFTIVTPFALLIALGLLILCFGFGAINDGHRWIPLPFGLNFQPSEFAKGAVILFVSFVIGRWQTENGVDKRAFKYICGVCALYLGLIGVENLSTAALLGLVVIAMMWIGRISKRQLGQLLGGMAIIVVIAISAVMLIGNNEKRDEVKDSRMTIVENTKPKTKGVFHRMSVWKKRINDFISGKEIPAEEYDLEDKAQEGYSQIAIASSNLVGKGPGNSVARDFLPQAYSDFIYAIIIEETGLIGAAIVCFIYIMLLFRSAKIASQCAYTFPAMLVLGLALMLCIQAMFNMGVAVGWLPVTGQPLPLISKGGTSSIMNCVYIGMIMSVSCSAKKKESVATDNSVEIMQAQTN